MLRAVGARYEMGMGNAITRAALGCAMMVFASGCAHKTSDVRRTQVVTFPAKAIVFYNGRELGHSPAMITLPQDGDGNLTARATVKVIPLEEDSHLHSTGRTFEPGERNLRVPDRVMLDMTGYQSTNFVAEMEVNPVAPEPRRKPTLKYTPRSKPTQVIGID